LRNGSGLALLNSDIILLQVRAYLQVRPKRAIRAGLKTRPNKFVMKILRSHEKS